MNRIILIGNGFDLAHKMETSYGNFMDWFWKEKAIEIQNKISKYDYFELKNTGRSRNIIKFDFTNCKNYSDFQNIIKSQSVAIKFKNKFLKQITERQYIQNWVDIENEYYQLLKDIMTEKEKYYSISELNSDFEKIKNELEKYLNEEQDNFKKNLNTKEFLKLTNSLSKKIYSNFKLNDFTEEVVNKMTNAKTERIYKLIDGLGTEYSSLQDLIFNKDIKDNMLIKILYLLGNKNSFVNKNLIYKEIRNILLSDNAEEYFDLELNIDNILFLNFNYTYTEDLYIKKPNQALHIHGDLDPYYKNPIIFGYGDELDEEYKKIETLNNNEYLENIKSIKYLETDNYKRLLEFVNSNEYQIFIFGHSCGISDRTLLNTLFEHENCVSIKPFYHVRKDGTYNYSDIVRNISRNFNNKAIMRDKVVNKTFCEPLA